MEKTKQEMMEYLETLRGGKIIYTIKNVSKSGMSRTASFAVLHNKAIYDLNPYLIKLDLVKASPNIYGVTLRGCGMDMIFHTITLINYKYMEYLKEKGKRIKGRKGVDGYAMRYDNALFSQMDSVGL